MVQKNFDLRMNEQMNATQYQSTYQPLFINYPLGCLTTSKLQRLDQGINAVNGVNFRMWSKNLELPLMAYTQLRIQLAIRGIVWRPIEASADFWTTFYKWFSSVWIVAQVGPLEAAGGWATMMQGQLLKPQFKACPRLPLISMFLSLSS